MVQSWENCSSILGVCSSVLGGQQFSPGKPAVQSWEVCSSVLGDQQFNPGKSAVQSWATCSSILGDQQFNPGKPAVKCWEVCSSVLGALQLNTGRPAVQSLEACSSIHGAPHWPRGWSSASRVRDPGSIPAFLLAWCAGTNMKFPVLILALIPEVL